MHMIGFHIECWDEGRVVDEESMEEEECEEEEEVEDLTLQSQSLLGGKK